MAKRLQHRGGTTSQHSSFTGAVREVTVDTDKNTLVVHDGATAGGHPLATATNFKSTGIDDNATSTAITIDSSENVGIGTTSPASIGSNITTLEITGGSTIRTGGLYLSTSDKNIKGYFYGSNTGFNIGSVSNSDLKFVTNNTERMRISSGGSVGIGTTTPNRLLTLGGTTNANLALNTSSYSSFTLGSNAYGFSVYDDDNTAHRLTVKNTGDVGIGTTSPTQALSIGNVPITAGGYKGLAFQSGVSEVSYVRSNCVNGNNYFLTFGTFASSSLSERMRIDNLGNVGIGNTVMSNFSNLPATNLVVGSGSGNQGITIYSGNTSASNIGFADGSSGDARNQGIIQYHHSGDYMRFFTSATERMRIDSSGQVGIGITPNLAGKRLYIDSTGFCGVELSESGTRTGSFGYDPVNNWLSLGTPQAEPLRFFTGSIERMRIDSSGNVLVGTTSTTPATGTSSGNLISSIGRNQFSSNSDTLELNRHGSDGIILSLRKDGTRVGSIGAEGGDLIVGTNDTGVQYCDSLDSIRPWNTSTNSARDGSIDLGTGNVRFKDLYLGGGLYVGGTAAANKLDDYEEGDWTPGYTANSGTPTYNVRAGSYTKVGRQVTVTGAVSGARGSLSGDVSISGLPFVCGSASKFSNSVSLLGEDWNFTFSFKGKVQNNNNVINLYKEATNSSGFVGVNDGNMKTSAAQDNYVQFTITYFTD